MVGDVVAEQHTVAAHRAPVQETVEARDAFHLGQRQAQRIGDVGQRLARHPDPYWHEADPYWHTDEYPWTPEDDWHNLHYYRPDWDLGVPTESDVDTGYTDDDHNRWGDAVYNNPSNGDQIEPEHHADDDGRHDSDCADCPPSGPEAQVQPGIGWLDECCDADSG